MKWIKGQGEDVDVLLDGVTVPNAFEADTDAGKVWFDDKSSYNGYSVKQGKVELKAKVTAAGSNNTGTWSIDSIPPKQFQFQKIGPIASGMPYDLSAFDKLHYDDDFGINPCRDIIDPGLSPFHKLDSDLLRKYQKALPEEWKIKK